MEKGYLCIVLHAHLPYVHHPEHEDFLEEDWLYEAITETYVPLINTFDRLVQEQVDFRITMSLTPPLCAMLNNPMLRERYSRHLEKLIDLAQKEVIRTRLLPEFHRTATMYENKLKHIQHIYEEQYGRNLVGAFKKFQDMGKLEIITCCATHGYLPLMVNRKAVRAQIKIAADDYRRNFGIRPRGMWLSECAYNPGDDEELKNEGIKFFFTDTHGILYGSAQPKYAVFSPVYCPSGVAAFGRDAESSRQVWSALEGYPGDFRYREFYRDVGYDLDYDYIKPYLHGDGIRRNIGLKYHKITGPVILGHKQPYDPQQALDAASEHSGNFMFNRQQQASHLYDIMGQKPIIVCPYDAELFGHWWFEGPDFLYFLMKKLHHDQDEIRMITPSEYLKKNPRHQVLTPSMSSWGDQGYSSCWLNNKNDWIYRHLHKAAERMEELAVINTRNNGVMKRAIQQAARELLLAQSSDWAFIMSTETTIPYAHKRTKNHINRFNRLYEEIKSGNIDEGWLEDIELKDNIFPELDYKVYA
ncbi:MAG: 1,4-alpha-glucan branching protein domain-containing protein [bacterium]